MSCNTKNVCRIAIWTAIITGFLASSNHVIAGDGWFWNPFKSDSTMEVQPSAASPDREGWHLPKLAVPKLGMPKLKMPTMQTPAWVMTPVSKSKSAFVSVGKTTKSMFSKTLELLDPYPDQEPVQEINTVNDYLRQSKVPH